MQKQKYKKNTFQDQMLSELWENAIFNKECFYILEKIIVKQSKEKNPEDKVTLDLSSEEINFVLSTVRNRNLITSEDQDRLRKTIVGFFGLSVGSHAALTWMMESRADVIKIVDTDTITPSNLNRLRFGWNNVGKYKAHVVENYLLEINPFSKVIKSIDKSQESMINIVNGEPPLSVIVDAIDDMESKIVLRKQAKKLKLPLVSAADVGDNVMLDIERYDIIPQPELFLGKVPNIERVNFSAISELERKKLIVKLVSFEKNSEQMLDSLLSIGKSLATWPQLGATATIAGGIVITTVKKIILGEKVLSGRYYISLDDILVSDFNNPNRRQIREEKIKQIKKKLKI